MSQSERTPIAPEVPNLPPEAIEFAKAVGKLCDEYNIRDLTMEVRVDRFAKNSNEYRSDIVSDVKVVVSKQDGRGRPRTRINVQASMTVTVPIVSEPDSSN
jgi:hypothetical protein